MKLWIINNSKFGYKNNSKEWINNMNDYFNNYFIPFIEKYSQPNDIIIHLGNVFNNTETLNISTLLTVNEIFIKLSKLLPLYLIDGINEKNKINSIFKNIDNVFNISNIQNFNFGKIIPNKNPIEYISSDDKIILFNSKIDNELLKNFPNTLFISGYDDNIYINDNIINVGIQYQLEKTEQKKGFFIIDVQTKKHKFIQNNYSPYYNTILIKDVSEIQNLEKDYIDKNFIDIIIDKSLIDDKNIKIDMLLSKFNFKSISYTNEFDNIETDIVDDKNLNIQEIIKNKIIKSNNSELLDEFENILKIFNEKY